MNELALFAGAGGGLLASRWLLGWQTVCAVEIDPYRQAVLLTRQADGLLDPFPIWDDVRTFDGRRWRGIVDVVTAGDPCQRDSNCRRSGQTPESLGQEVVRIVGEIKPRYVMRENPSHQRKDAEWSHVRMRDALRAIGYAAECIRIKACCTGADHRRARVFVLASLANTDAEHVSFRSTLQRVAGQTSTKRPRGTTARGMVVADKAAYHAGRRGTTDDVATRMDRLAALGDGQVPAVVAEAWRMLESAESLMLTAEGYTHI